MMFHLPVVAQNSELGLLPVASAACMQSSIKINQMPRTLQKKGG